MIAGVEDKENDDTTADSGPESEPDDAETRRGKGLSERETATIVDAFRSQVSRCWDAGSLAGAPDAEKLVVAMRIRLNRDGSLNGLPEYLDTPSMGDPYYRAAAEAGRRAIMQCQNYDLPADSYDGWRVLDVEFNPAQMLGL